MTQPTPYTKSQTFAELQSQNSLVPIAGSYLDAEFGLIQNTVAEILTNLAIIQKDDAALANGIVTPDSLSATVVALMGGWIPQGAWATAYVYEAGDLVTQTSNNYVAVVNHTSGVFATDLAAGKWQLVASTGAAGTAGTGYAATSASSITIGTGTKVFTTQAGLAYSAGALVRVSSRASLANYMDGNVVSYSGVTLTVNVTAVGGTGGPFVDWNINSLGATGATGPVGAVTGNGRAEGRLTLTTGAPVMGNVAAATAIYYTPWIGSQIPIWDGVSAFTPTGFSELSNNLLASVTNKAGPAAAAASKNYDVFVWSDAGTLRLTRGAYWFSDTARSTATENDLLRTQGILVNKNTINNGPAAGYGTYVGTFRTDGSSQCNWNTGGLAAGGTAATLHVWNAYNRIRFAGFVGDTADTWTYTLVAVRAANAATGMRASYVHGDVADAFEAAYHATGANAISASDVGIGFDVTNALSGRKGFINPGAAGEYFNGTGRHTSSALGFHFMQACESVAGGTTTFLGDNGAPTITQTGLDYEGWF